MIPNIFISSTISDLGHLRDSIRDVIQEIGYNPVMSEYGEVGYLPSDSAENSCYLAMRDCQLAIIIVGKRYGSISKNGFSVTHNEFRTAKEKHLPIIFLVSEEVMSFKVIYEANDKMENISFPGMDNPAKLFGLIREFAESETNNGLISFTNVPSAKANLKKQLAHITGDLLKRQFDPVQGEIKDILTEITTLRHLLLKKEQEVARQFSIAFRFLISEENKYLKEITENVIGTLEEGVPELLKHKTFKGFLTNNNVEVTIMSTEEATEKLSMKANINPFGTGIHKICSSRIPYETSRTRATVIGGQPEYDINPENKGDDRVIFGFGPKKFTGNTNAEKLIEAMFSRLIQLTNK